MNDDCKFKLCKNAIKKYENICIGIDQSYQNTGISIAADGKLIKVKSVQLEECKSNTEKRYRLKKVLDRVMLSCVHNSKDVVCIFERIRLQSKGFLNLDYIKSIGALNSVIIDACHDYMIDVYSVDTRCWKAQVVGTSKPMQNDLGVPCEKWPTIQWVVSQGFENSILIDMDGTKKTKGIFEVEGKKYMYNNDAADSAGIAMFWFEGDRKKLKEEK